MQDGVERARVAGDVDVDLERVALAQIAERRCCLLDAPGIVGTDQSRQRPTDDGIDAATKQLGDVCADLAHLEVGFADHREHPPGLDAARNVDRLSGAIAQIDGRTGRQQVRNRPTVRHRRRDARLVAGHMTAESVPVTACSAGGRRTSTENSPAAPKRSIALSAEDNSVGCPHPRVHSRNFSVRLRSQPHRQSTHMHADLPRQPSALRPRREACRPATLIPCANRRSGNFPEMLCGPIDFVIVVETQTILHDAAPITTIANLTAPRYRSRVPDAANCRNQSNHAFMPSPVRALTGRIVAVEFTCRTCSI